MKWTFPNSPFPFLVLVFCIFKSKFKISSAFTNYTNEINVFSIEIPGKF